MIEWEGFTEITAEEFVDAECQVYADDTQRTFYKFIMVGFDVDESEADEDGDVPRCVCITAADIRDIYRGIKTLERVYQRAMGQFPPEVARVLEAEIIADMMLEEGGL